VIHEATTPAAVLKWAEFSGDFNPIHFDLARAAKAGSDRLIVHGMLALLHVKQATMRALAAVTSADDGWSRFKALFRNPIPQSSRLDLSIRPKNEGVRFVLQGDSREYGRGVHETLQTPPLQQANASPAYVLEAAYVQAQHARFCESFRFVHDDWIFLDALIFGKFLQQRFGRLSEIPPDIVAVQVSHSVSCVPRQLKARFSDVDRIPHVGYSVRNEDKSASPGSESGVAELDVFVDGSPAMVIEIGLLAKAGVPA
jgi:hypothetical protein